MSLHETRYPEAVDVEIAVCLNRHPCVFSRNVFDKAFTAFFTAIENKSVIKALPQPFLFCDTLLAGHGTADMLRINILLRNLNVIHSISSPIGAEITAKAELIAISENGKMYTFKVEAYDNKGLIGEGTHERAIIDCERFMKKCLAKLED